MKNIITSILTLSLLTGSLFYLDYGTQNGSTPALKVAAIFNSNFSVEPETLQGSLLKNPTDFTPSILPDHLQLAGFKAASLSTPRFGQTFLTEIEKSSKMETIRAYDILSQNQTIIKVYEISSNTKKDSETQFESLAITAVTNQKEITRLSNQTFWLISKNDNKKRIAFQNKNSVLGFEYDNTYHPQVQTLIQTLKAL